MADTDTMKFGPQWLRQLSDGGGNVCSPPPTPAANLGPFGKFKLADFRYGKEEMLALYTPSSTPPEALKIFTEILCETGPQKPVSVAPLTEDEQRLLMHGVNSDQVYRMMSNSHRGSGAASEQGNGGGAAVEAGVTRAGGGAGSGGRAARGRGARRGGVESAGEPVGGGEVVATAPGVDQSGGAGGGVHGHVGQPAFHRSTGGGGGPRGRGSRGAAASVPENQAPGRGGGYRGRPENSQAPAGEAGDSNGDWRRVSRQRNPSESDTDWRRGPRTGSTKDNLQQRSSAVGGSGGRVGANSRGGGARNEGGSWRQRGAGPGSDQRHLAAGPGNHSGRGRGYQRDKAGMQRSNSEEEMPEWVYDENGSDEAGTGFFDSSGAYKPTNSRGGSHRQHRVRQYSAGSGPHNPDTDDYWEDDWETDFTLYDDLDGSGRHEVQEDVEAKEATAVETVESKARSGSSVKDQEHSATGDHRQMEKGSDAPRLQPQCLASSDKTSRGIRESSASPNPSSTAVGSTAGETSVASLEQLINSDSSIKAVVTSGNTSGQVTSGVDVPAPVQHSQQTRWFYRDPQGRTQGPFAAAQMQDWYKAGFFDPSLAVRRECDTNFFSLESYFKTFGSQTFSGNAPANAASLQHLPVNAMGGPAVAAAESTAMHLLLRQHKMQEMMLTQQLQSPEKSACPPFPAQQDMLNWFIFQQQLLSSGMAAEQIEAVKRQHPMFAASAQPGNSEAQLGLTTSAATVSSPMDANLLPSFSAWPAPAKLSGSCPPDAGVPDDMMAWHNKLLAQQLAHQKAMQLEREEMERERAELMRQHQQLLTKQSEEAEERRMRKEAEELDRRRKEVEERERQVQREEAQRREKAALQEEERRELERRRVELEETERKRREAEETAERQRREAEEAAALQAAQARRQKEEAERREAEEATALFQAAQVRRKKEEAERRREEERRRAADEEARRRQEAEEAAERERRAAMEEALAAERRRRAEEETRRVQLSKFQLPEAARWASAPGHTATLLPEAPAGMGHGGAPSLAEIQRLQQQREEREAQEKRAMRLEKEAAKLSAQRQAQMGPWLLNSGAAPAVSPTTTAPAPTVRNKSFMEIQAEEAAREMESRHTGQTERRAPMSQNAKSAVSPGLASVWGSNWASKVQQASPPVVAAAAKPVATKQQQPAPAKVSVWGCAGSSKQAGSEQQQKAFPALASAVPAGKSGGGKKKIGNREEERVSKLFTAMDGSKEDELTRWCKTALDRIRCPTQLDKAMFVEYLVQMETAADIEDMMTAYYDNVDHINKFVADFLEKRRQFRKAQEEGTKISFADAFSSKQAKEDEFQKVGSSNKAGGGKRNRKKKQQKVSNLLNITATADPDRFNAGEIDYAN